MSYLQPKMNENIKIRVIRIICTRKKRYISDKDMKFVRTIESATNENIVRHWGESQFNINYKDKTILDLGASYGDAAEYFIFCGAKLVICIESNESYFKVLEENSERFDKKLLPIFVKIKSPEDVENLIKEYKPDIIKADIEGAEVHIVNLSNELWKTVPEYIIETHEPYGYMKTDVLRDKCKENNYTIVKDLPIYNNVLYAKKEEVKSELSTTENK